MTGIEKARIIEFLKTGDILGRIIKDMDSLGYIGESRNKLLGYLIAISRKLDEPLSGIAVSSSGAGKSKLIDTLQLLIPPEDVVFTSRLTQQALFYMPKDFLKNKLLIIEERAGSELADYAIRTLQSKGKLALAIPVKKETVFIEVLGPVSVLETTTSHRLNQENLSRCFILHLDESIEQTERIHKYQRFMKTRKAVQIRQKTERIIPFHQNIQKMIKKIPVIIPYAERLSFPANSPSLRRDNQKLLTLIEAVALMHQYQRRKIKKDSDVYIESAIADYRIAYDVFSHSFRHSLIPRHSVAGELLSIIARLGKNTFTRKDIASFCSWPDYKVRDNIRYLENAGRLQVIYSHKGKETLYRLQDRVELVRPDELKKAHTSTT